jgi:AbrB family looped-hinge helix DNA binding protein
MPKGQVTLPKNVRERFAIESGDQVAFVVDDDGDLVLINPALYGMRELQQTMSGKAAAAGFHSEEDVSDYITELRREKR